MQPVELDTMDSPTTMFLLRCRHDTFLIVPITSQYNSEKLYANNTDDVIIYWKY